jgi:hypothetical protein
MNASVLPFQPNWKSFLIATFVLLVVFNLVLGIFHRIKLSDWFYLRLRDLRVDPLVAKLRAFGKAVGGFLRRRKKKVRDEGRSDEVEMGEMGAVTT